MPWTSSTGPPGEAPRAGRTEPRVFLGDLMLGLAKIVQISNADPFALVPSWTLDELQAGLRSCGGGGGLDQEPPARGQPGTCPQGGQGGMSPVIAGLDIGRVTAVVLLSCNGGGLRFEGAVRVEVLDMDSPFLGAVAAAEPAAVAVTADVVAVESGVSSRPVSRFAVWWHEMREALLAALAGFRPDLRVVRISPHHGQEAGGGQWQGDRGGGSRLRVLADRPPGRRARLGRCGGRRRVRERRLFGLAPVSWRA